MDIWLGFGPNPDPVMRPANIFTGVTQEGDVASTSDNDRDSLLLLNVP